MGCAACLVLGRAVAESPADVSTHRGTEVLLGFALLAAGLLVGPRRFPAAAGFAAIFALYGGLSAAVAAPELVRADEPLRVAKSSLADAFTESLRLTVLAGLTAVAAGAAGASAGSRVRWRFRAIRSIDVERIGRFLVLVGYVGLALALIRVLVFKLPGTGLHDAIQSFWDGGAYLLVLAHLALPGLALWIPALLHQGAHWRAYLLPGALLVVFVVLLIPTGQRTYGIEAGLVVVLALTASGVLSARRATVLAVVGIVLLGVTQAARDEVRETNRLTLDGTAARLAPEKLTTLYGGQFASFRWTVEATRYRDRLVVDRPLLALVAKPVPRQLYSGKPEDFSEQFTKQLHPDAAAEGVNFATPLVAEARFSLGWQGAVAVHGLLGLLVGLSVTMARRRLPQALQVAAVMAAGWTGLVFIRGDVANAALAAATWVIPVAAVLVVLSRRQQRSVVRRVVVDALQVPPQFSGLGTVVRTIGRELGSASMEPELVLRCPADARHLLEPSFPDHARVECPISGSHPRLRRLFAQQVSGPLRDARDTLVICPGDQGPLWGRSPVVLAANDVRRLTRPADNSSRTDTLFYRVVQPWSIRRADIVLTISRFSRLEIERTIRPWRRVRVVELHPPPLVASPPDAPGGHVLLVGALRPYKGVETALEAMALADPCVPPLLVVGSDEDRRAVLEERCRQLGVEDRVAFLGWVDPEELEALYRSSFAVLAPSFYEGYDLPVAEGLASGVPVVASAIPPHWEVAGDTALLVMAGDAPRMGRALSRLATDPTEWRARADSALRRSRYLATREPRWGTAVREVASTVFEPTPEQPRRDSY